MKLLDRNINRKNYIYVVLNEAPVAEIRIDEPSYRAYFTPEWIPAKSVRDAIRKAIAHEVIRHLTK